MNRTYPNEIPPINSSLFTPINNDRGICKTLMTSDKEREFYGIVEGLDEPDISAASYIPKQCYGCPRAAELRRRIAMTAWTYSELWKNCFDIADGDPDLGKAIVRAMDRLKQQNLQARNELSQLIAQCKEC